MTHICVVKLTIIGSDNGLSPGRRQAIIWTNAGILLIGPLGTNFSYILIGIQTFPFKKMHLKMSSAKWRPFCLGLNVIRGYRGWWCSGYWHRWDIHNHTWCYQYKTRRPENDNPSGWPTLVKCKKNWKCRGTHKNDQGWKVTITSWNFRPIPKSTVELLVLWKDMTSMWCHCNTMTQWRWTLPW